MGGSGGRGQRGGGRGGVLRVKEKAGNFKLLPNFNSFKLIFSKIKTDIQQFKELPTKSRNNRNLFVNIELFMIKPLLI